MTLLLLQRLLRRLLKRLDRTLLAMVHDLRRLLLGSGNLANRLLLRRGAVA